MKQVRHTVGHMLMKNEELAKSDRYSEMTIFAFATHLFFAQHPRHMMYYSMTHAYNGQSVVVVIHVINIAIVYTYDEYMLLGPFPFLMKFGH